MQEVISEGLNFWEGEGGGGGGGLPQDPGYTVAHSPFPPKFYQSIILPPILFLIEALIKWQSWSDNGLIFQSISAVPNTASILTAIGSNGFTDYTNKTYFYPLLLLTIQAYVL